MENNLILSVFCGLDLLGLGFEKQGFCVVQSKDILFGGDIRRFKPVQNRFDGLIGGSPCQDFSKARRTPPTGYGLEMLAEFKRVVIESNVSWFLLENVPTVPDIQIEGYQVQRFDLCPSQLGFEQHRPRHFQFGSKDGFVLQINRQSERKKVVERCVTASESNKKERRNFSDVLRLQGLEPDLDLSVFTQTGKYKLVGNGVHVGVASEVARAIKESFVSDLRLNSSRLCACGCGRILTGKQKASTNNCRQRIFVKRNHAAVNELRTITPES